MLGTENQVTFVNHSMKIKKKKKKNLSILPIPISTPQPALTPLLQKLMQLAVMAHMLLLQWELRGDYITPNYHCEVRD